MGVSYERCVDLVEDAAAELYDADPRVRSVGVTRHEDKYGFRAVRNNQIPVPLNAGPPPIDKFEQIPIVFTDTFGEVESLVMVPGAPGSPVSPSATSVVPEVNRHRPLVAGLQIQNFDDDDRQGVINQGFIIIGTLGCFVNLDSGLPALLSNNHVVAGENRGQIGDRILQPGSSVFDPNEHIANLTDFVRIIASPPGAKPRLGNVTFNDVDAGVAQLVDNVAFKQGYLPFRSLVAPTATAPARVGDRVFKVGRTTGLTHGEVKDVATIVGPITYAPGECWFRRSITIEGLNGTQFSDKGDSGSAIVRTNGEIVGILYAGNGIQTYACPINTCLTALNCTLA